MGKYLFYYYLAVSLVAVILFVYDKNAAKRHAWRIRESTLLLFGALGGALCGLIAMKAAHHKTRKAKFKILMPLFAILHAALLVYLFSKGVLAW